MSQSSAIVATTYGELVSLRKLKEKNICHQAAIRLQPLPMVSPKETQDVKTHWPQIAEVHIKGMISVSPDSCIFPYLEKH